MSNFSTYQWFRNQKNQPLNENVASQTAQAIDQAIASIDDSMHVQDFAKAVGKVLKGEDGTVGFGTHLFKEFMETLHAELGMEESLNEAGDMVTYKVEVILADPYEGGPDYSENVEVKINSSLSGDELKDAVRDAIREKGYTRKSVYDFKYEKA